LEWSAQKNSLGKPCKTVLYKKQEKLMINVPSVKKYHNVVPKMPGSVVGSESGSDPKNCSENSIAYYRKYKSLPVQIAEQIADLEKTLPYILIYFRMVCAINSLGKP
jgi:hypothetical protein